MTVKRVKCREHDGWFKVVVKPGRPPVRCTEENQCDKAEQISKLAKATGLRESQIVIGRPDAKPTRKQLAAERDALEAADKAQRAAAKAPVIESEPRSPRNRSVPLAQACKAELEALGWTAKGRGWFEEPDGGEFPGAEMAEVTAVRGSESLVITWNDGKVSRQDYNLWHSRRSMNGAPASKLKFNPDEMTDRELIRAISGMKVTWWNTLGKTEESYTIGGTTISIEHFYASNGDEDTHRRLVKFVDMNGNGYRHFHVEALIKVG